MTPETVHYDRATALTQERADTLSAAYQAKPIRQNLPASWLFLAQRCEPNAGADQQRTGDAIRNAGEARLRRQACRAPSQGAVAEQDKELQHHRRDAEDSCWSALATRNSPYGVRADGAHRDGAVATV